MKKQHSNRKYVVRLTGEERSCLEQQIRCGTNRADRLLKARILLKADADAATGGLVDTDIVAALDVSERTVQRVRQRFVEAGLEAALTRKCQERPSTLRIFDGEKEARLIQLACSEPPEGHARWTLRLLERHVVELGIVDAASDTTIHRVLKKTNSSLIEANIG